MAADAHAVAELHRTLEHDVDVEQHVAAHGDRAAQIDARRIDQRHALRHELARAPAAILGLSRGQLQPVVDALHFLRIGADDRDDAGRRARAAIPMISVR